VANSVTKDWVASSFNANINPGLVQNCPTPKVIEPANAVAMDSCFFSQVFLAIKQLD
jgi:hypothetical protein